MSRRFYTISVTIIFVFVGILHGYRVVNSLPLIYNGWAVPMWVSMLATLMAFILAVAGLKELR